MLLRGLILKLFTEVAVVVGAASFGSSNTLLRFRARLRPPRKMDTGWIRPRCSIAARTSVMVGSERLEDSAKVRVVVPRRVK